MSRLDGKVAIVTGAGSGLGSAMAAAFVAEGASVMVAEIDEHSGAAIAARLNAVRPGAALYLHTDVRSEVSCSEAVTASISRWGKLDVMVANAGIGATGSIARLSLADFERVIAVNLTGVFLCAKYAIQTMRESGGGVILATASVAGLRGTPGLGAYGPSKAAVIQLIKTIALEGAAHNIRANALCPVWAETPLVQEFVASRRTGEEAALKRLVAEIPLGRLGRPEDVAAAAVYLASDDAAFISGVAFPIDGASTA